MSDTKTLKALLIETARLKKPGNSGCALGHKVTKEALLQNGDRTASLRARMAHTNEGIAERSALSIAGMSTSTHRHSTRWNNNVELRAQAVSPTQRY